MEEAEKTDRIIERVLDEARGLGFPGLAERLQRFTAYAQRVGYYEMLDRLSQRAIAEGRSYSELVDEAQRSGELPTRLGLEARMLAEQDKLN